MASASGFPYASACPIRSASIAGTSTGSGAVALSMPRNSHPQSSASSASEPVFSSGLNPSTSPANDSSGGDGIIPASIICRTISVGPPGPSSACSTSRGAPAADSISRSAASSSSPSEPALTRVSSGPPFLFARRGFDMRAILSRLRTQSPAWRAGASRRMSASGRQVVKPFAGQQGARRLGGAGSWSLSGVVRHQAGHDEAFASRLSVRATPVRRFRPHTAASRRFPARRSDRSPPRPPRT